MPSYDVIVVGGGHAGIEAARAPARMGLKVLLLSLNRKMIGNMPCNPSIGGSAKGIVVREVDALGGLMAVAADHDYLQIKMLNVGKGPGVRCLRAQEDKRDYPAYVQHLLDSEENLTIRDAMVVDLIHDENAVKGVILSGGERIAAKAVILATGTYLKAKVLRGEEAYQAGPDGEQAAVGLSGALARMGFDVVRLKTGTPPRIRKSSIDFSKTVRQDGGDGDLAFSYETTKFKSVSEQLPCWLAYTNERTHEIIRNNLTKSAQYSGAIKGIGPRYCPSIEGKVVLFKDKKRHQLFLEPEFKEGESIYLDGLSTSMPRDVQEEIVHSIVGLERAEFLKYGYAIEYDALDSTQFDLTLRSKRYGGLYGAGQILGTSGYEEAAGLGLLAGINAALAIQGKPSLILKRSESYIGVMIDDLVTKGTDEPYRLLSSRAEYRLLLRHDNADLRLTEYGHRIGLISEERYRRFLKKNEDIGKARQILLKSRLSPGEAVSELLAAKELPPLRGGVSAYEFLKRPEISYADVASLIPELMEIDLPPIGILQLETVVKYEGYIQKEEREAASFAKYEDYRLPTDIDYLSLEGLRLEAREKLNKIKPMTVGQAGRVRGVNPSDVAVLIMLLKRKRHGF